MDEIKHRILTDSVDLFFKYGIRSLTMDDISRELGISKKTLYKYFTNKGDLVEQGVKAKFEQISTLLKTFGNTTENAIDELFAIDEYFDVMMRENHPAVMFQLSKYYPETFKWLDKAKDEFVLEITRANLEKGIKQELYRPDIKVEYICYIYMAHTHIIEGGTNVPQHICESPDFHKHHLIYHIRGIASEKGITHLNNKLNKR